MTRMLLVALALAGAALASDASAVGAGMSKNAGIAPHCRHGRVYCGGQCIPQGRMCRRAPRHTEKSSAIVHARS